MIIMINAVIENEGDEFIATHNDKDGNLVSQIVLNNQLSQVVVSVNDGDTFTVQDVVEVTATDDLELTEENADLEDKLENALNEADNSPAPHVDSNTIEG